MFTHISDSDRKHSFSLNFGYVFCEIYSQQLSTEQAVKIDILGMNSSSNAHLTLMIATMGLFRCQLALNMSVSLEPGRQDRVRLHIIYYPIQIECVCFIIGIASKNNRRPRPSLLKMTCFEKIMSHNFFIAFLNVNLYNTRVEDPKMIVAKSVISYSAYT